MNRLKLKAINENLRKHRVRTTVRGTAERPRLSVDISNRHVSAQIIDDEAGKTLAAVSTVGAKNVPKNITEKAVWVGTEIAKKAKVKKVKIVTFDRGSKLYHGRVKALADAAREQGLEF